MTKLNEFRTLKRIAIKFIFIAISTVILAACLNKPHEASSNSPPSFKFGSTEYVGQYNSESETDSFLGIPFAQPPIGDLRWMPPQAIKTTSKKVIASRFSDACMQGSHLYNWYQNVIKSFGGNASDFSQPAYSEDCLYLNIWRPHKRSTERVAPHPVFVFIHGGSNKGGWSYEPNYIGEQLAAEGAVVITIAYRLGIFGFFAHPELEHANFGLLDQIAALNWIKQHASQLGGNPNNITIAGESSGASNISYLLTSPLAAGLFKRAIHQSAGWAMRRSMHKTEYDELGVRLAASISSDKNNASLSDLRKLSSDKVFASAKAVYAGHFYDPVIDQKSVTAPLAEALLTDRLNADDLLIGSNANEALMYVDREQSPEEWLAENVPEVDPQAALNLFDEQTTDLQKLDLLATAYGYTCPSLRLASMFSEQENKRSWVYFFAKQRDGELAAQMGAYHGAELPYIFNTHDEWLPTSPGDITLGASMMDYWIQFAREGNPNSSRQPIWYPFTTKSKTALKLDIQIESKAHPSLNICSELLE